MIMYVVSLEEAGWRVLRNTIIFVISCDLNYFKIKAYFLKYIVYSNAFQLKISISHLPHLLRLCPQPQGPHGAEKWPLLSLLLPSSGKLPETSQVSGWGGGCRQGLIDVFLIWLDFLLESSLTLATSTSLCSPLQDLNKEHVSSSRVLDGMSHCTVPQTCVSVPSLLFQPTPILCSCHSFLRLLPTGPPTAHRGEKKTQWQLRPPMQIILPSRLCQLLVWGGGQGVGLASTVQPHLIKPEELHDSIWGRGPFKVSTLWLFHFLISAQSQ